MKRFFTALFFTTLLLLSSSVTPQALASHLNDTTWGLTATATFSSDCGISDEESSDATVTFNADRTYIFEPPNPFILFMPNQVGAWFDRVAGEFTLFPTNVLEHAALLESFFWIPFGRADRVDFLRITSLGSVSETGDQISGATVVEGNLIFPGTPCFFTLQVGYIGTPR